MWIGIDIGGTGIKGGLVDHNGELLDFQECSTPVAEGGSAIMNSVRDMIVRLEKGLSQYASELQGVGIGTAGRVDYRKGKVLFATENLPGWTGMEIKSVLEQSLSVPVVVDNDVNVAALGEACLGSGIATEQGKVEHLLFVALGTGVGGAYLHEGALIRGFRGGAAEIGHLILHPDGLPCNCGQKGCLEQYVSGTALDQMARSIHADWSARDLMQAASDKNKQTDTRAENATDINTMVDKGSYSRADKVTRTVTDAGSSGSNGFFLIEDAAKAEMARQGMKRFARDLALGLVSMQNAFDPQMIVLGGSVTRSYTVWSSELQHQLRQLTDRVPFVLPACLGNKAGLLGAARLAMKL